MSAEVILSYSRMKKIKCKFLKQIVDDNELEM